MRRQAVHIDGSKSTGIAIDQLAAFIIDCRGLEERGLAFVKLEGRTTMGGKLYQLHAEYAEPEAPAPQ